MVIYLLLIPIVFFIVFVFIYYLNKEDDLFNKNDIISKTGKVILTLSDEGGIVVVKDNHNKDYFINCKSYKGEISEGSTVLITEYSIKEKMFKAELL